MDTEPALAKSTANINVKRVWIKVQVIYSLILSVLYLKV